MPDLESQLRTLGTALDHPSAPPMASRVGAELGAEAPGPRRARPAPRLRLALAAAAALLLLAAGAAAAVPSAREAVLELLGLRGAAIERVPVLPEGVVARPGLRLGQATTPAEAVERLSFSPLLPRGVGAPNGVFVSDEVPGGTLTLTYPPRPGLPASTLTGVGLLVNELDGYLAPGFFGKLVPRGVPLQRFSLDGQLAVWVKGLHAFFYKPAADHTFHIDRARLAANTLLVQRGEVMVRLEGEFDKATAVAIAESLAP
jgi:hypothetical protein